VFAQLASELSQVEEVHINVPSAEVGRHAENMVLNRGGHRDRLIWHHIASNDVWSRDHGPIFVTRRATEAHDTPPLAMLDWDFNAWGAKFAADLDNLIPDKMNDYFKLPRIVPGLVMEGGSLEVNGAGDLLTTEAVLLRDNRNPNHSREQIESALRLHL